MGADLASCLAAELMEWLQPFKGWDWYGHLNQYDRHIVDVLHSNCMRHSLEIKFGRSGVKMEIVGYGNSRWIKFRSEYADPEFPDNLHAALRGELTR